MFKFLKIEGRKINLEKAPPGGFMAEPSFEPDEVKKSLPDVETPEGVVSAKLFMVAGAPPAYESYPGDGDNISTWSAPPPYEIFIRPVTPKNPAPPEVANQLPVVY